MPCDLKPPFTKHHMYMLKYNKWKHELLIALMVCEWQLYRSKSWLKNISSCILLDPLKLCYTPAVNMKRSSHSLQHILHISYCMSLITHSKSFWNTKFKRVVTAIKWERTVEFHCIYVQYWYRFLIKIFLCFAQNGCFYFGKKYKNSNTVNYYYILNLF